MRPADQAKVASPQRRAQIGIGSAPAPPAADHLLIEAAALLVTRVVVRVRRQAARRRGLEEGLAQGVPLALVGDHQRAIAAAPGRVAAAPGLGLHEVGQHVLVRPASAAELGPVIVVRRLAAHIEMAIDRARSADQPAAREVDAALADMRAGRGLIAPVELPVADRHAKACRDLDEQPEIRAASLQDHDLIATVLAKPIGEHAAGSACAHDHVVGDQVRPGVRYAQPRIAPMVKPRTM